MSRLCARRLLGVTRRNLPTDTSEHYATKFPLYVSKLPGMSIRLKGFCLEGNKNQSFKDAKQTHHVQAAVFQHLWRFSRRWLDFHVTHYELWRKHVPPVPLLVYGRVQRSDKWREMVQNPANSFGGKPASASQRRTCSGNGSWSVEDLPSLHCHSPPFLFSAATDSLSLSSNKAISCASVHASQLEDIFLLTAKMKGPGAMWALRSVRPSWGKSEKLTFFSDISLFLNCVFLVVLLGVFPSTWSPGSPCYVPQTWRGETAIEENTRQPRRRRPRQKRQHWPKATNARWCNVAPL